MRCVNAVPEVRLRCDCGVNERVVTLTGERSFALLMRPIETERVLMTTSSSSSTLVCSMTYCMSEHPVSGWRALTCHE